MCGITGFVTQNLDNKYSEKLLTDMLGSMEHRGPNGSGYVYQRDGFIKQFSNCDLIYEAKSSPSSFYTVAIAQNRLSINDRRPVAIQPIHNEDKNIFLIHNGEIYNHRQLRKDLQEKGHRFYTNCDSEVIVHLYEEEGLDGIEKLIGAYAFCLWDIRRDRFIMGRDKYGEKPLFYSYDNGCLVFNSEIKAFRRIPQFNFDFSPAAAGVYLAYGNMVPPFTWFKNIHKLEPGHLFIWEGKNAPSKRPMRLTYYPRRKDGSFDDYQDRFKSVFHEVIKDTVETRDEEVDCCVCLSGGIDSSLTTLYVNDIDSRFSKFSLFGKTEGSGSELSRAQIISRMTRGEHHIDYFEEERTADVEFLTAIVDEPLSSLHDIDIRHSLYSLISRYGVVVISSSFADYVFLCGSSFLGAKKFDEKNNRYSGVGRLLPSFVSDRLGHNGLLLKKFDPLSYVQEFNRLQIQPVREYLLDGELVSREIGLKMGGMVKSLNPPDAVNMISLLRNGVIRQHVTYLDDLIGFSHQIEVRDPFADSRLREFVCTVPLEYMSPLFNTDSYSPSDPQWKYFLRKALEIKAGSQASKVFQGRKMPFGTGKMQADEIKLDMSRSHGKYPLKKNRMLLEKCFLNADRVIDLWSRFEKEEKLSKADMLVAERLASLNIWLHMNKSKYGF